jgi:hypothetical protein
MAHASIGRFRFDLIITHEVRTLPWWKRWAQKAYARLSADTPPSEMARLFAYSYGAASVPAPSR